ncbi:HTH_Tnp_Tc3_2 domain-containing protein [Trichonephila clavipes]|nr:HTH_Tnp_Tc3_2 domain-containing protein [Trichonephila clavipes]
MILLLTFMHSLSKVKHGQENAILGNQSELKRMQLSAEVDGKTVVRRPLGGRSRVTTPAEDRYIAIVAKRNHRVTSPRVTSMVTASIGKVISAATVRRRLHMNGLYARVP